MTFQLQIDKNSFQFHIIFVGTNPITDCAYKRTKQSLKEIRHVYLDIDREKLSLCPQGRVSHTAKAPPVVRAILWCNYYSEH